MKCVKVEIKKTQTVKKYLIKNKLINFNYESKKNNSFFYFPIIKSNNIKKRFAFVSFVDVNLKKKTKKQPHFGSYDVVGDIAIVEKGTKTTAEKILNHHKNIKTVLSKEEGRKGVCRLQKYRFLAGKRKFETIHKENNIKIKVNLKKMYFSPRLSNERKRIAKQIKKGEMVLVMFSGCAVYNLIISKNSDAKIIYGVEINKDAHKYAEENVKLNKLNNIKLFLGNVRNITPKLKKRFDRIMMPLPKTGKNYLDIALKASKKGTIIHFYGFLDEKDVPKKIYDMVKKACKTSNRKYKILRCVRVGQFAPRKYRVCVDFKIL